MLHAKPIARTMRSAVTARRRYTAWRRPLEHGTVPAMEAREEPNGPGYDDWFDEPELPTETQSGVNRGVHEDDADEVWVLPEDEDDRSPGQREFVIAGRTLTVTQVAIIGLSGLAIIFAILAAFGVFNGGKPAAAPVAPLPKTITKTVQTSTAANTTPSVPAPDQTLNP